MAPALGHPDGAGCAPAFLHSTFPRIPKMASSCVSGLVSHERRADLSFSGRDEEAKQTLAKLHNNGTVNDYVQFEYDDILTSIRQEHSAANPIKELFTKRSYFRPLLLGIILQFSVQMTGVSALQYYSSDIFKAAGFTSERALYFQAYNSIIALAAEVACIFTIDRVGRRWPLICANVFSGITFAIEFALIVVYPASSTNNHAHLAFIMMT